MCCAATLPIGSLLKYYLNKIEKTKELSILLFQLLDF
jgi:hypothetical protein